MVPTPLVRGGRLVGGPGPPPDGGVRPPPPPPNLLICARAKPARKNSVFGEVAKKENGKGNSRETMVLTSSAGGLVGLVGKTMVPSLARVRMTVGQRQGASGWVGTAERGLLAGEGIRDFGAGER